MNDSFETFLNFYNEEATCVVGESLKEHQVDFTISRGEPMLGSSFPGSTNDQRIHLKIRRSDFEKAHTALDADFKSHLEQEDPDYFHFSFSVCG